MPEDIFLDLKCYKDYKYAFRKMREYNPKIEALDDYSKYLLETFKECLVKVDDIINVLIIR